MADGIVTSHPATLTRETAPRNPTYQPRLGSYETSMSRVLNLPQNRYAHLFSVALPAPCPAFLSMRIRRG